MIVARVVEFHVDVRPVDLRPVLVPAMLFALGLLAVLVSVLLVTALRARRKHAARNPAAPSAPDDPRFVRYLDPETQRVIRIPAAELAPGSVRASRHGSGEDVWVAAHELQPGPLLQPPFAEDVRELIREIQRALERVHPQTLEQWEDGFRRDLQPEREIAIFLHVGQILRQAMEDGVAADVPQREKEIYRVLAACMVGTPEHVRHILGPTPLSPAEVQQLADRYYGPADPP